MIPRSPWKPARLFLTVLSSFPLFQAPCFSAEALVPSRPSPAYMLQTQVEYPAEPAPGARISIAFTVGSKKLWSHRQPSSLSAAVIIPETGRSFLELGSAPSVELRVYTRHGIQLLDQKILPRAVSFDGGLIAYDNSADGNCRVPSPLMFWTWIMGNVQKEVHPGPRLSGDGPIRKRKRPFGMERENRSFPFGLCPAGRKGKTNLGDGGAGQVFSLGKQRRLASMEGSKEKQRPLH